MVSDLISDLLSYDVLPTAFQCPSDGQSSCSKWGDRFVVIEFYKVFWRFKLGSGIVRLTMFYT